MWSRVRVYVTWKSCKWYPACKLQTSVRATRFCECFVLKIFLGKSISRPEQLVIALEDMRNTSWYYNTVIRVPLTVLNLLDTVSARTEYRCLSAARPRVRDANVSRSGSGSDMLNRHTSPGPGVQTMSTPSWNSTAANSSLSAHDHPEMK